MATSAVDEEENVLTCTVCLESYTDPCSLQCKHSFCRRCITNHVKTQAHAVKTKTIPCPSCRQVTRVPDPSRPVDEWAGQLQPGHVIQELIARVNKDTTMEGTPCFQCEQLGETTPGKFLCAECEVVFCQRCGKGHSVIPSSSDHDLCDLKDQGQVSRRKRRCSEHRDKLIELYCKNCNVSHCHLCFVDHHRKCEDVVTLKSFVSNMKTELSTVYSQFKEQTKKYNNLVEEKITRLAQLNTDKTSVIDAIRRASQEAVYLVKKKENKLIDEVEKMTTRECDELKANVKVGNIQLQTYKQNSEYINQALNSNSEVEVCHIYQVWKSGQLEVSQIDKGTDGGIISSLRFSKQNNNAKEIIDTLYLGEIEPTYPPTDFLSSPVLSETVCIRVDQDEKDTDVSDIIVLQVEGVQTTVIIDANDECVTSLYTRNNKTCQSRLQLNASAQGMTQLGNNNVMVAVNDPNQIVTVTVTPDLVNLTHINTSKAYDSLAVMSTSRLAAGAEDCVDILDMQGEVMKSIRTHNNTPLFTAPDYMCVNNTGHLLVSDMETKTITCLTPEGEVAWIYSGTGEGRLNDPRGIRSTSEGYILVVDRDLQKVIQLTESGMYVRNVVISKDGLMNPRDIYVDKLGSLFIFDSGKVLKFVFTRKSVEQKDKQI